MNLKKTFLFAIVVGSVIAFDECATVSFSFEIFTNSHAYYWVALGFLAPFLTAMTANYLLRNRTFDKRKDEIINGLFVYTLLGMTISSFLSLGIYHVLEYTNVSVKLTILRYFILKFFESSFYMLFKLEFSSTLKDEF